MIAKMTSPNGYTMSRKTLGRLLFGFGTDYNQVYSVEMLSEFDIHIENELESFQYQVFSQFKTLSDFSDDDFLSLNWLSGLLEAFVACHQDFKALLSKHTEEFLKPPLDKLLKEFFDRSIKALDICNAVCDGIDKIRCAHKRLEIVSDALYSESEQKKVMNKGQFRRARRALTDLSNIMLDSSKDSGWFFSPRLKSFGHKEKDLKRSLSRSVSNSWSASKQLQSLANSLIPPRANEITATHGLANVVFTMGFIQMFVLWALVAAIPCQDRGLHTNFSIPNHFLWANPLSVTYLRILNESKKRDRKNSVGLLKEIYQMEKSVRFITCVIDSTQKFPLTEDEKEKVKLGVDEVSMVSNAYENWLYPLECQVRKVFHKIMSCRLEGLEILSRARS